FLSYSVTDSKEDISQLITSFPLSLLLIIHSLLPVSSLLFRIRMTTTEPMRCLRCGKTGGGPSFGTIPIPRPRILSLNRSSAPSALSACNNLELEAVVAMHENSFAVRSICVSEMLPRTDDIIFVNVKTIEGQPYCLELTRKGWRVTSIRTDCMMGDFTKWEMFVKYYDSLGELLYDISPEYQQRLHEKMDEESEACLHPRSSTIPLHLPSRPHE
ncbi:hypothetical protein PMAYCL1PPCAC_16487, partial [Pristionchus mayeri]